MSRFYSFILPYLQNKYLAKLFYFTTHQKTIDQLPANRFIIQSIQTLPHKVRPLKRLPRRHAVLFPSKGNTLHQKRHIVCIGVQNASLISTCLIFTSLSVFILFHFSLILLFIDFITRFFFLLRISIHKCYLMVF